MTNVQMLQLAQSTAAAAVSGSLSVLATIKASVAAFDTSGHPDEDWPAFNQNFTRELQSYKAAAQKDAAPIGAPPPRGPAAPAGLPASVLARLPAGVAARVAQATAAANPGQAPAPADLASGPASAVPV